jgi:hypothetical protein
VTTVPLRTRRSKLLDNALQVIPEVSAEYEAISGRRYTTLDRAPLVR